MNIIYHKLDLSKVAEIMWFTIIPINVCISDIAFCDVSGSGISVITLWFAENIKDHLY